MTIDNKMFMNDLNNIDARIKKIQKHVDDSISTEKDGIRQLGMFEIVKDCEFCISTLNTLMKVLTEESFGIKSLDAPKE